MLSDFRTDRRISMELSRDRMPEAPASPLGRRKAMAERCVEILPSWQFSIDLNCKVSVRCDRYPFQRQGISSSTLVIL